MFLPCKKSFDQPSQHIKKQRNYFANKSPCSQGYGFSSGHVWTWELDYEESWALKNWCFRTVVLDEALESSLDCKESQPVHPKGNQLWIFIGKTDAEAEIPILWPPDAKNWLIEKDPDAGKDWGQEEKGTTENEMAGWHHWLYGHEFKWVPGVGDGQGSLACFSPWGHKELDTTEWLNELTLVIASLPRTKPFCLFICMAAVTIFSDFGAQENKLCHCFHGFHSYLQWSDGTGCHDICFLNVEF